MRRTTITENGEWSHGARKLRTDSATDRSRPSRRSRPFMHRSICGKQNSADNYSFSVRTARGVYTVLTRTDAYPSHLG